MQKRPSNFLTVDSALNVEDGMPAFLMSKLFKQLSDHGFDKVDDLSGMDVLLLPKDAVLSWTKQGQRSKAIDGFVLLEAGDSIVVSANGKAMEFSLSVGGKVNKSSVSGESGQWKPSSYQQSVGRANRFTSIDDLSADQRAALITFRAQNGRSWKQKLLAGWQRAAYPGALQQIRNQFGPEWLTKLKHVPEYRLDVTMKTADGCVGTYSVSLDNRGQPKDGPITWSPQEPDAETDLVTIKCHDGDELKQEYVTDGDLWRALEDGGLHEELWDNVLKGQSLSEAIEAMPVFDNKCRI